MSSGRGIRMNTMSGLELSNNYIIECTSSKSTYFPENSSNHFGIKMQHPINHINFIETPYSLDLNYIYLPTKLKLFSTEQSISFESPEKNIYTWDINANKIKDMNQFIAFFNEIKEYISIDKHVLTLHKVGTYTLTEEIIKLLGISEAIITTTEVNQQYNIAKVIKYAIPPFPKLIYLYAHCLADSQVDTQNKKLFKIVNVLESEKGQVHELQSLPAKNINVVPLQYIIFQIKNEKGQNINFDGEVRMGISLKRNI